MENLLQTIKEMKQYINRDIDLGEVGTNPKKFPLKTKTNWKFKLFGETKIYFWVIGITLGGSLAWTIFCIYVAYHFIIKYW